MVVVEEVVNCAARTNGEPGDRKHSRESVKQMFLREKRHFGSRPLYHRRVVLNVGKLVGLGLTPHGEEADLDAATSFPAGHRLLIEACWQG